MFGQRSKVAVSSLVAACKPPGGLLFFWGCFKFQGDTGWELMEQEGRGEFYVN